MFYQDPQSEHKDHNALINNAYTYTATFSRDPQCTQDGWHKGHNHVKEGKDEDDDNHGEGGLVGVSGAAKGYYPVKQTR